MCQHKASGIFNEEIPAKMAKPPIVVLTLALGADLTTVLLQRTGHSLFGQATPTQIAKPVSEKPISEAEAT
jgi:hypothetical protein